LTYLEYLGVRLRVVRARQKRAINFLSMTIESELLRAEIDEINLLIKEEKEGD